MRETEERVTVVETGGGSGAGAVAGILVAVALVVALLYFFGGNIFGAGGGDKDINVSVDMPKVETPAE